MKQIHKPDVVQAIDELKAAGEIGAADVDRLYQLLKSSNSAGVINTSAAADQLFDHPEIKQQDKNFRSFLTRARIALKTSTEALQAQRANNPEDEEIKARLSVLEGFELITLRKTTALPRRLQFKAVSSAFHQRLPNHALYRDQDYARQKAFPEEITVFVSYAREDQRLAIELIELLRTEAKSTRAPARTIWMDPSLRPGERFSAEIEAQMSKADVGLALLSQDYLDSRYVLDKELPYLLDHNKLVPVFLTAGVKLDALDALLSRARKQAVSDKQGRWLNQLVKIHWFSLEDRSQSSAFSDCYDDASRRLFARRLVESAFEREPSPTFEPAPPVPVDDHRAKNYLPLEFARTKGKIDLTGENATEKAARSKRGQLGVAAPSTINDVVEDIIRWALDSADSSPSCYALLGAFGMGKTYTTRVFTRRFNEIDSQRKAFYIDLRDAPAEPGVSLLEEIIERVLSHGGHQLEETSAQSIIKQAHDGRLIMVVDGLDERLSRLGSNEQQYFMSELLRLQPPHDADRRHPAKLLLTCRSHYFETHLIQSNFFRQEQRGVAEYRGVELLPFDEAQMEEALSKKLPPEHAKRLLEALKANIELRDLASRPYLLHKLTEFESGAVGDWAGQGLASLYEALVEDTLNRDEEKHTLQRRHKKSFLEDLAAWLWQDGQTQLDIDRLNDWYQGWIDRRGLRGQYPQSTEILEKDIRNSSLLVRTGERDFGFGHTSMMEFFLAKWLLKQFYAGSMDAPGSGGSLSLSDLSRMPSQETLDFFEEMLASGDIYQQPKFQQTLRQILQQAFTTASEICLRVLARWATANQPQPTFETVNLRGLQRERLVVRGFGCKSLDLADARLPNSIWRDLDIETINLDNTALTESFWERCGISKLKGVARSLDGNTPVNQLDRVTLDVTCVMPRRLSEQVIEQDGRAWCEAGTKLRRGSMLKSLPANMALQVGHRQFITTLTAYGELLAVGSVDGTVKLWGKRGRLMRTLEGHGSEVPALAAYGELLAVGSVDGTVKLWDKQGRLVRTLEGHGGAVTALAAYGELFAAGSSEGVIKLWDKQGRLMRTLEGHGGVVFSLAAYGELLAAGSSDGAIKLWDKQGRLMRTLEGHGGEVFSLAAYGELLAAGSSDGTIKLWDKQGRLVRTLEGHGGVVPALAAYGELLAAGSSDGAIKLWDKQGRLMRTLEGHGGEVFSLAAYGELLAAGSSDGTIKLWDKQGRLVRTQIEFKDGQWLCWQHSVDLVHASPLAWRYANFSDGEHTWPIDTGGFELHPAVE